MDFFQTVMGKRFFEAQLPKLINSIENLAVKIDEMNKHNSPSSKNIVILKDLGTGETDAIIISETSTAEEINACIQKAKEEKESDWQFDDLVSSLPDDCTCVTQWSGDLQSIYY